MPKKKKIKPKARGKAKKAAARQRLGVKALPSLRMYRKISISFILGSTILLGLVLYLVLMRAEIIIIPTKQEIGADLIVDVETWEGTISDAVSGYVADVTLEENKRYEPSGASVEIPAAALGKVIIYNNLSRNQTLVARTRLLSSGGVLFRIKERVNVPARGSVEVEVYADSPGKEGEINPTYFTIPGLWEGLQDKVFAKSGESMVGGMEIRKAISQQDIEGAFNNLTEIIIEKAKGQLQAEISKEKELNHIVYTYEILARESDEQVGSEKEEFMVRVKLHIVAVSYDSELKERSRTALLTLIPTGKELQKSNLDILQPSILKYDLDKKTANLRVGLKGWVVISESSPLLELSKLIGVSKEEAANNLFGYEEIEEVEIKTFPFWLKNIPKSKDRVKIVIIDAN